MSAREKGRKKRWKADGEKKGEKRRGGKERANNKGEIKELLHQLY